jgi:hypothetical protein
MALWFSGTSKCSICALVLDSDQDVIGHPHLLPPNHALWRFSDSAMHRTCYERWEHHEYFELVLLEYKKLLESRPGRRLEADRVLALSNEEIARLAEDADEWGTKVAEDWKGVLLRLGNPSTNV